MLFVDLTFCWWINKNSYNQTSWSFIVPRSFKTNVSNRNNETTAERSVAINWNTEHVLVPLSRELFLYVSTVHRCVEKWFDLHVKKQHSREKAMIWTSLAFSYWGVITYSFDGKAPLGHLKKPFTSHSDLILRYKVTLDNNSNLLGPLCCLEGG